MLIFFGGSDTFDNTRKVLVALSCNELSFLAVDIVIGVNYPDPIGLANLVAHRTGTTLYQNISSLAGLMLRADLFIGAGGSTTWERMCLGLPALVISVAENQQKMTYALTAKGYQCSIETKNLLSSTDWSKSISHIINHPFLVSQMSEKAISLVDGMGTQRVVQAISGKDNHIKKIRKVNELDKMLLLRWANDPDTRKQSFDLNNISELQHELWFTKQLSNPDCYIFIGENIDEIPVGQVRFEINRELNECLISVSIERCFRGMRLSEELLKKSINQLLLTEHNLRFIAEVRIQNQGSHRLFTKLQFNPIASRRPGSITYELNVKTMYQKRELI